jgi:hypothetical protein
MFTVEIKNNNGLLVSDLRYDNLAEAVRNAKAGTKNEQGRAIVTDSEDNLVYDFFFESHGIVRGYDSDGTLVYNT